MALPVHFLLRLTSLLIVVLIVSRSPNTRTWTNIVYGLALAHYLLALLYSRRQIVETLRRPYGAVPLLSIAILGIGLYLGQFSLLIYFALHHAFNEAFMIRDAAPADDPDVKALRGSAVLVHILLYLFILRRQAAFSFGAGSTMYALISGYITTKYLAFYAIGAALTVSYAAFFYYLYRVRRFLTARTFVENCGMELVGLFLVAVSFSVSFSYLHVVLYHVVFWSLYPIPKLWSAGAAKTAGYLILTAAAAAVFLALSPIGLFTSRAAAGVFQRQFILWTYVHITSSLLLSNAHPEWIVNLFRPRPERAFAKSGGLGEAA